MVRIGSRPANNDTSNLYIDELRARYASNYQFTIADMKKTALLIFISLISSSVKVSAYTKNYLQECWNKQVKTTNGQFMVLSCTEKLKELYHSPEPWQEVAYSGKGTVWYHADKFSRRDTLISGKRTLFSKTCLNKDAVLYIDYGHKDLSPATPGLIAEQMLNTCRYSPAVLINYFLINNVPIDKESNKKVAVYQMLVNKTVVKLYIQKKDNILSQITMLSDDELRGDELRKFTYQDYASVDGSFYPKRIEIDKINGKIKDTVSILNAGQTADMPILIEQPADYTVKADLPKEITLQVETYSSNIHFINIQPVGARAMVVEFNDFLLVAEAPLSSKIGERIIAEVKKIAPGKPIRYFAFGHHHPDYIGGMRAFVHKGATILSVKDDIEYLNYLAASPHTVNPDSLQMRPKAIKIQEIGDSTTITDGKYEMKIYVIGKKSHHTKDYLVYYFPTEKLLVEDDLVWIEKKGTIKKAGESQAGLYNAVKDIGIKVETVIQCWGLSYNDFKMTIPFEDIEQSVIAK